MLLPFKMLHNRTLLLLISFFAAILVLVYLNVSSQLAHLSGENRRLENLISAITQSSERGLENSNEGAVFLPKKAESTEEKEERLLEHSVIVYNRVPKTASTSFMGLAYDLCKGNKFNVLHLNTSKNSHIMSLDDQRRFVMNITGWKEKQPALYHGHIAFIDFNKFGVSSRPIFINLIRDPLDRLVSYYYFLRYGDDFRPHVVRKRKGNTVSFDECVSRGERDCDASIMWLQIPFFCGHAFDCWVPGNEWALTEAKRNLINNYLVVGVTEQLHDFVALLEATLPRFFKGATKLYEDGTKSHLRKTYNKVHPSAESVAKLQQSTVWKMEQDFYEFALNQFNFLKKQSFQLDEDGSGLKPKGQQFFYEKIRPRL